MITPVPSIGRRVWYWPTFGELNDPLMVTKEQLMNRIDDNQAFDAGVVFVHSPTVVNLVVTDHDGRMFKRLQVRLLSEDQTGDLAGGYCEWMPYQKLQNK